MPLIDLWKADQSAVMKMTIEQVVSTAGDGKLLDNSECQKEGSYEVRLEQGESVWADREERDAILGAMNHWQGGATAGEEDWN